MAEKQHQAKEAWRFRDIRNRAQKMRALRSPIDGRILDQKIKALVADQERQKAQAEEPMSADVMDAKIEAAEARTDTKFAELLSEMKLFNTRLDHVEKSTAGIKATVVVTGIAAVGLVVAIFAWGSQMFGTGMDVQTAVSRAASAVTEQTKPQIDQLNARYDNLEAKIGQVLEAVQARQPLTPQR